SVLWHRKLIVIAMLALAIGAAAAALQLITPQYRATATLAGSPANSGTNYLIFLPVVNQIASICATSAGTPPNPRAATRRTGRRLGAISVRTFQDAPILKIDAVGTNRALTAASAQAVAQVLLERVNSGQVGVPGLKLTEIDTPSVPKSPFYPNTKLTYAVAVLVGLGLGIAAAFLGETLGRRVRTRSDLADAAGVPVFAEIALTPAVRSVHSLLSFGADSDLRTVSEALRDLRTSI